MSSFNATEIQREHYILAERVVSLCTNLKHSAGIDTAKDELDDLLEFLSTHISGEEKLMQSYGYKGLEHHQSEHDNLVNKLSSLSEKFCESFGEEQKRDLLSFLEKELSDHISEDVKLGVFPITTMPGGSE